MFEAGVAPIVAGGMPVNFAGELAGETVRKASEPLGPNWSAGLGTAANLAALVATPLAPKRAFMLRPTPPAGNIKTRMMEQAGVTPSAAVDEESLVERLINRPTREAELNKITPVQKTITETVYEMVQGSPTSPQAEQGASYLLDRAAATVRLEVQGNPTLRAAFQTMQRGTSDEALARKISSALDTPPEPITPTIPTELRPITREKIVTENVRGLLPEERLIENSSFRGLPQGATNPMAMGKGPGMTVKDADWLIGSEGNRAVLPPMPTNPSGAAMNVASGGNVPRFVLEGGELTQPILKQPISNRVVSAAGELFTKGGVARDPERLISDQVTELLASGKIPLPELDATLKKHGVTFVDLANDLFRPAVRDAAQRLNSLSVIQKRINDLIRQNPEAGKELDSLLDTAAELDETVRAMGWWKRADNIRRGMLVTQLATAVRNAETQAGRVGIDVMESALDAGLQSIFNTPLPRTKALDGLETVMRLFRRGNKAQVDKILSEFPAEHDRMFGTFSSDIANKVGRGGAGGVADKVFTSAEKSVAVLNTLNRGQEFLFRRAIFSTRLDQRLAGKGRNLQKIIDANEIGGIDPADIKDAVSKSLEMTFAESPKWGSVGQKFVSFVNALPGATLPIPFPRFLVNSLKFFTQYSPMGFLKVLSSAERAKIAAGDTKSLSRAIIGTGLLGGAWEFRNSEYAGEQWYEAKLPSGRTLDLRVYNPFTPYLFVADVIKRMNEGRLNSLTTKDLALGVLSANLRAGTGLMLLDQILDGLFAHGDAEKSLRQLKGIGGETVAGFLIPLQQLQDALSQFNPEMQTIRDKNSEPFLGPLKAKIPGMSETLPPAYSPTRSEPLKREEPLLRQATGLTLGSARNPIEKELARLGFDRREILTSYGDPQADRMITQNMGPMVEKVLIPLVESPGYSQVTDAQKGEMIRRVLSVLRHSAVQQAVAQSPKLFFDLKMRGMPKRQRAMIEEAIQ